MFLTLIALLCIITSLTIFYCLNTYFIYFILFLNFTSACIIFIHIVLVKALSANVLIGAYVTILDKIRAS
jgi:hypothetical protein